MDYRGDRGRRGEERQGGRLKKGSRRQRKGAIERHIGKRCERLGRGWTRGDIGRRGEERQGGELSKGSRRQRKGAIERHREEM